jgi:glycosyltransferase involved in cell wall biosynthesis
LQKEKVGRLAATVANRVGANLLATSYCASEAFRLLRPDRKRVLFQVHPHPRYLRGLYNAVMASDRSYGGLANEPEVIVSENELTAWERESALADQILCASSFTKHSLVSSGIARDTIKVIPYGVDSDFFRFGRPDSNKPFTVLYVGQKVARKGLELLLSVWNRLQLRGGRLLVAGGHVRDSSIANSFAGSYEEVPQTGLAQLANLYQNADLFVMPSIAEGFGHVYLEALSSGTPIICTNNTGGVDIIRDGESGWIVPACDRDALAERIAWCFAHRQRLQEMRLAARSVAEKHTWAHFREQVRNSLLPDYEPVIAAREESHANGGMASQ